MENTYGPITAGLLIFMVTLLTQFIKDKWPGFSSKQVQLIALLLAFIFLLPFHVLTQLQSTSDLTWLDIAWLAFTSVVYSILGWLSAIGAYEVGIKPAIRRGGE